MRRPGRRSASAPIRPDPGAGGYTRIRTNNGSRAIGRLTAADATAPATGPDRPPLPLGDGPVVLVLPARDEAARIAAVIERLPADVLGRPTRCLVVDDGSADDTVEVATVVRARSSSSTGPAAASGAAVRTGLKAAVGLDAAAVAFCDADGEYDPAELATLRRAARRRARRLRRRARGSPGRSGACCRTAGSATARSRSGCGSIAGRRITDGQSGYRALSARAAAECQIVHDYNYAQVLTLDAARPRLPLRGGADHATRSARVADRSCASGATCAPSCRRSGASSRRRRRRSERGVYSTRARPR